MKLNIGCLARFSYYPYEHEVDFARGNGFDMLQIHYDRNGLFLKDISSQAKLIKDADFPGIIHALLDINEIEEHILKLNDLLKYLGHKEIIIHPICRSEEISETTIYKLSEKIACVLEAFRKEGVIVYLENNSKLDPVFTSTREIDIMFKENPGLEFLIDIAHIDDYNHLKEMVEIKLPKMLHITDRRLDTVHGHVPIGQGNIDFEYIFKNILNNFDGKVIIEICPNDADIIYARDYLKELLSKYTKVSAG